MSVQDDTLSFCVHCKSVKCSILYLAFEYSYIKRTDIYVCLIQIKKIYNKNAGYRIAAAVSDRNGVFEFIYKG